MSVTQMVSFTTTMPPGCLKCEAMVCTVAEGLPGFVMIDTLARGRLAGFWSWPR